MVQEIQVKLKEFLQRAQELHKAVLHALREEKVQKQKKTLTLDGIATLVKEGLGITKRTTKTVANMLTPQVSKSPQLQQQATLFQQWYDDVQTFLSQISQQTKSGQVNSEKLLQKLNRIDKKVRLDTKLKHATIVLEEISRLPLVYNTELIKKEIHPKKRRKEQKLPQFPYPLENLDPDALLENGETELVEFKRYSLPSARDIAKEMAAMGNNRGGILAIGISDEGEKIRIENARREEERICQIARKTIKFALQVNFTKPLTALIY